MHTLNVSDIELYVKSRLDELSNNEDAMLLQTDSAVEDLDKLIEASVVQSIRVVELAAPNVMLKGADTMQASPSLVSVAGRYKCVVDLPGDFLRLVSFRMSDWTRPIQTLFGEDSVEYRKQGNPYLMGTYDKPIGFLLHSSAGGKMELFSSRSQNATIATALYLKEPVLSAGAVSVVKPLEQACLDMIVASTLRSVGMYQQAALYERIVADALSLTPDILRKSSPDGERVNSSLENKQRL